MGKNKVCNSIKHSVYMGDGVRLFYEKDDIIAFSGKTDSLAVEIIGIACESLKSAVKNRWQHIKHEISRDQPDWPPHSLMCSCRKCSPSITNHKRFIKSMEKKS